MGKANDSIKYNRSYPEFNGTDEGMIQHKERSGAKAAALIPTTTFVASATAAMLLLLLALARIALVRPALLTVTTNSAQVEVRTDLEGSEDAYPLVYLLVPYEPGQRDPVTPGGRLRLSEQEVEALGDPVLQGEIYTRVEQLLFQGLDNRFDYLLLFCSEDENGELVLRREALYIRMVRIGDPDSPNRPGPIPDDSTPKGPVAIAITPAPATPAPDPATPPQTATSSATATATSSATATATSTATATPYDETTPYIPPTDDSTPTPVPVPHNITIRNIGRGQGLVGVDPDNLSPEALNAHAGDTVYVSGEPENLDDEHYVLQSWRIVSGDATRQGSWGFIMGNTDVELEFTFVRAYRVTVVNEMPEWGTATYQDKPQDFPAGESVSIHCEPSTHYEFVVAHDETEHYYFTDPDFTFPMPEQDLTLFVMFDKILVGLTIEPASGGSCSYSPDAEMEVGNTYYFQEGSTVTIAATGVIEDHVFAGYYVNGSSTLITDDPLTLTMDADTTVTPVFSQLYTIRITNDAPAYGTVTCNGTTLNGTTPSMTVKAAEGETITFQASPVAGSTISGVMVSPEGAGTLASAGGGTYTYTVGDESVSILVNFAPRAGHAINISVDPAGSGSYTFASTPTYPQTNFPADADFTVTATPAAGYRFLRMEVNGGSGGGTFTDSSVTLTMPEADVNIVLYFEELPKYSIWVDADPEEVANVFVSGTGVETTSDGFIAPEGTEITLSYSMANDDYAFDHYIVNGTAITGNTFTLTGNTHVVASCRSLWHEIDVGTDPVDLGTVTVSCADPDALYLDGEYYCLEGTTVTFSYMLPDAIAADYRFVGYRVNGTLITGNTYTVTSDITVTAVFESKYHNITIIGDPDGVANMPTHGPTLAGQPVSFHWDIADDNYQYTGYDISGEYSDLSVTDSTCSFTMGNTDVTFTAHFAVKTTTVGYSVYLDHAEPAGSATLYITPAPNGASNTYLPGTTVTLYAYENTGYAVDSISAGGVTIAGDSGSFTVTGDMPVVIYCHSLTPVTVSQPDAFGGSTYTGTTYHEPGSVFDIPVFPDPGCTYYLTVNGEAYAPGVSGVPVGTEPISVIVTFIPQ